MTTPLSRRRLVALTAGALLSLGVLGSAATVASAAPRRPVSEPSTCARPADPAAAHTLGIIRW